MPGPSSDMINMKDAKFFNKKKGTRMGMASRLSLISLMGRRLTLIKSSIRSLTSNRSGINTDSRCYKHSPRVGQHFKHVGEELANFEAEQWYGAFSAMGGLRKRGEKAPALFTVLNKAPYHCESLSREFQVRYGEIIKRQPPVFRKQKKAERIQICNCVTKEALPIHQDEKLSGPMTLLKEIGGTKYYLPRSCVQVRWDPATHGSVDRICEWLLTSFGPFVFTTRTASNSMLVAFETMDQARKAVQCQLSRSAKIFITWQDVANYNFGHYVKFYNYTIIADPIWRRGMEDKTRMYSRSATQSTVGSNLKGQKRLKITESYQ